MLIFRTAGWARSVLLGCIARHAIQHASFRGVLNLQSYNIRPRTHLIYSNFFTLSAVALPGVSFVNSHSAQKRRNAAVTPSAPE